ncbi:MAG: hypothetical protein ACFE96_11300 [Candidatus Hermodarchaeota archaeon]
MKENDLKELKKRGFDPITMEQKPKPKLFSRKEASMDVSGLLIVIAILLFIILLLFIPQAIYYIKILETLS